VEAGYNPNPYHNSVHAADVTQNVGFILASDELTSQLSQLEVLAMLLAACVHDLKHPGDTIYMLRACLYVAVCATCQGAASCRCHEL